MATPKTVPRRTARAAPDLARLIYTSRATVPLDGSDLAELVRRARAANHQRGVTGVLVHDADRFLQVIEGPGPAVAALALRIREDARHEDIDVISEQQGVKRAFAGWDMQLALRHRGGTAEGLHPLHPPGALFAALHGSEDRLPALLTALARSGARNVLAGDANLPGHAMARLVLNALAPSEAARLDALVGGASAGIEAVARRIEAAVAALGRMWREDRCTGLELAAGLASLQGALRRRRANDRCNAARVHPAAELGHVAVAAAPGEPHILGAVLKADLLRAHGWHVTVHFPSSGAALGAALAETRPDGLVVASSRVQPRGDRMAAMREAIAAARRAANKRRFFVVVGGLDFARGLPAPSVGADLACRTAADVARLVSGFARPATPI
jgi:methanogenic corrinoid protein MtbC1